MQKKDNPAPNSKVSELTARFNSMSAATNINQNKAAKPIVSGVGPTIPPRPNLGEEKKIIKQANISPVPILKARPVITKAAANKSSREPSNMEILFAAAVAENEAKVEEILKTGLIPDCTGIHTTCGVNTNPTQQQKLPEPSKEKIEGDIIAKMKHKLIQQQQVNLQQGQEIAFLQKSYEESTVHGFIIKVQKNIASKIAQERELEIAKHLAETSLLSAKAEEHKCELLKQQQLAEEQRQQQAAQLAAERERMEKARLEAITLAENEAKARVAAEQARIIARLELDRPFGGPHHESHQRRRLHVAVFNKDVKEIGRLITAGATVDITDSFNHTPLWYAAFEVKDETCAKELIKGGAIKNSDITNTLASIAKSGKNIDSVNKARKCLNC